MREQASSHETAKKLLLIGAIGAVALTLYLYDKNRRQEHVSPLSDLPPQASSTPEVSLDDRELIGEVIDEGAYLLERSVTSHSGAGDERLAEKGFERNSELIAALESPFPSLEDEASYVSQGASELVTIKEANVPAIGRGYDEPEIATWPGTDKYKKEPLCLVEYATLTTKTVNGSMQPAQPNGERQKYRFVEAPNQFQDKVLSPQEVEALNDFERHAWEIAQRAKREDITDGLPVQLGYILVLPRTLAERLGAVIAKRPRIARELIPGMINLSESSMQTELRWQEPPFDDWRAENGGIDCLAVRISGNDGRYRSDVYKY